MSEKKHIVCYSGGHSSGLVAIEVVRKFGKENVILLNHNINSRFENEDIKRFKKEVADYLGLKITYANCNNEMAVEKIKNQFEVCIDKGTFVNPANRQILCTYVLKTEPFHKYLETQSKENEYIIYYGFDQDEPARIDRRKTILNDLGYDSDYPLALWGGGSFDVLKAYYVGKDINFDSVCITENFTSKDHYKRTINNTSEIGINKPNTYSKWKHANCIGCLKAGQQHWYVVYCEDYEVFEMGKAAENILGHCFGKEFLKDIEPKFKRMKEIGIPANEHIPSHKFWKSAKHYLKQSTQDLFPCECFV
jgi:hypothetical protein